MEKEVKLESGLPLRADTTPVQSLPSIFLGVLGLFVMGGFVILKMPFIFLGRKIFSKPKYKRKNSYLNKEFEVFFEVAKSSANGCVSPDMIKKLKG